MEVPQILLHEKLCNVWSFVWGLGFRGCGFRTVRVWSLGGYSGFNDFGVGVCMDWKHVHATMA